MAWNIGTEKSTFGNKKVMFLSCTADAATSQIDTGLGIIDSLSICPQSLTSGAPKLFANKGVSGTSIAGSVGCSGFTSGDVFFLTVYGR